MEHFSEGPKRHRTTPPDYEAFLELCQQGTVVPVVKRVTADLMTPVSAFLRIAGRASHAFLLESVEGGEKVARYSFLGTRPHMLLHCKDGEKKTRRRSSRCVVTRADLSP